jgi:DNA adenine methylase
MLKDLIKPPFRYIGAKTKLLDWIYSFFPAHSTFVDVFGGTGVVIFNKTPSKNDVYNDINSNIVNFYRVLRDEYKRNQLQDLIALTPYSRKEFNSCKEPSEDDVEAARRFYVRQNQSFSATGRTWGFEKNKNCSVSRFYNTAWGGVLARMQSITFDNLPFERMFKNYDSTETLFYCDPPYVETSGTNEYAYFFGEEEQKKLIDTVNNVQGFVIISGYQHDSFNELLDAGWTMKTREFKCTLKNTKQGKDAERDRVECLYLSPRVTENCDMLFTSDKNM